GVDHGADRDGYAAQRHDVGVDALVVHHDEGDQHTERKRDDGHERASEVEEECEANDGDDDELLGELVPEVVHGALDQLRAVVGRHDLHARGQAALQLRELRLDRGDRFQRVLPGAHHDYTADDFTLTVQVGHAAAHLGPQLDVRDIPQENRDAR